MVEIGNPKEVNEYIRQVVNSEEALKYLIKIVEQSRKNINEGVLERVVRLSKPNFWCVGLNDQIKHVKHIKEFFCQIPKIINELEDIGGQNLTDRVLDCAVKANYDNTGDSPIYIVGKSPIISSEILKYNKNYPSQVYDLIGDSLSLINKKGELDYPDRASLRHPFANLLLDMAPEIIKRIDLDGFKKIIETYRDIDINKRQIRDLSFIQWEARKSTLEIIDYLSEKEKVLDTYSKAQTISQKDGAEASEFLINQIK